MMSFKDSVRAWFIELLTLWRWLGVAVKPSGVAFLEPKLETPTSMVSLNKIRLWSNFGAA
jgi:hypothetical protein